MTHRWTKVLLEIYNDKSRLEIAHDDQLSKKSVIEGNRRKDLRYGISAGRISAGHTGRQ